MTKYNSKIAFLAAENSVFAYRAGVPVTLMQFKLDVLHTAEEISKTKGETLITAPGRYAFSVGLLSSWLAGRVVILPPDSHQLSWKKIRDQHIIGFECDAEFNVQLLNSKVAAVTEKQMQWTPKLAAMQTALKLYTSGSTGMPSVVEKSLDNLLLETSCVANRFNWSNQAIVGTVPAQHLYGLTFTILLPWILGVPIVDEVPFYPQDISTVVAQTNAATLISVPAHYNVLLKNGFNAGSLNCLSSTAPLSPQTATKWKQLNPKQILEIYGSTETGVIGYRRQCDDPLWTMFAHVELTLNSNLLTVSSAFIHPQFGLKFQTADEAIIKANGKFTLLGRKDAIIKIAGKRISLVEIEQALLACSGISDAAVVAVDVEAVARDKAIWAAIVSQADSVHALRQVLISKLEGTKIPKRFVIVDRLPRNSSGKVSKQALLELFKTGENVNV